VVEEEAPVEAVVDDVAPDVDDEDLVQLISNADKALSESDFERAVQLYTKRIAADHSVHAYLNRQKT
jgi:hypothetical protein